MEEVPRTKEGVPYFLGEDIGELAHHDPSLTYCRLTNADDKTLKAGAVYNVGFAIHDDNITTREHQVSSVTALDLGAKQKMGIQAG